MRNPKKKERFMEAYRAKLKKMTPFALLREWDHVRYTLNPDCTVWDSVEYHIPKAKEYDTEKVVEPKKPKIPVFKCNECDYCERTQKETGRYEFFCRHPKVGEGIEKHQNGYDGSICFGRKNGEMILKTSPMWCPKKKEEDK